MVNDTNYTFKGKILVELQGFTGPYYPKKNYDFDLVDKKSSKAAVPISLIEVSS